MTADERRMLEMLAASGGCTDALLVAHGFALDTLADMVRAGLATAKAERVFTPNGRAVEITSMAIIGRLLRLFSLRFHRNSFCQLAHCYLIIWPESCRLRCPALESP
jgi:hypothetical protein